MAPSKRIKARFLEHLHAYRTDASVEDAVAPASPFGSVRGMIAESDPWGWMEDLLAPVPTPARQPVAEAAPTDSVEPAVRKILDDLDGSLTSGRKEIEAAYRKLKAAAPGSKRAEDIGAFLAVLQETWALMGALQKTALDEFPARARAA